MNIARAAGAAVQSIVLALALAALVLTFTAFDLSLIPFRYMGF